MPTCCDHDNFSRHASCHDASSSSPEFITTLGKIFLLGWQEFRSLLETSANNLSAVSVEISIEMGQGKVLASLMGISRWTESDPIDDGNLRRTKTTLVIKSVFTVHFLRSSASRIENLIPSLVWLRFQSRGSGTENSVCKCTHKFDDTASVPNFLATSGMMCPSVPVILPKWHDVSFSTSDFTQVARCALQYQ